MLRWPDTATIDEHELSTITGGIWYGQPKSARGERWAAQLDDAVRRSPIGGGLAALPVLAIGEAGARIAGHVWDVVKGPEQ